MPSHAAGERQKPYTSGPSEPARLRSSAHEAVPAGQLAISLADLAAVLQNPPLRNRKRDRTAPTIVATLIGAWTVVMLAFMQHGFNDLETGIVRVETGLEADIARVETSLKTDIAEVKAEVTDLRGEVTVLRSDLNAVDERLSVLIGILNLRREVDDAAGGRLTTRHHPTPPDSHETTRTIRSTMSGVIWAVSGPLWV